MFFPALCIVHCNKVNQLKVSICCPKELEAASRSSKTYLAKNGGGRSAPI